MITELNQRSREILRRIIESYVETGEPVGSRTLSKRFSMNLSPATIRNVMADLEDSGLLFAPHTSAGRMPTEAGLRLFVDGILEVGNLTEKERNAIDVQCAGTQNNLEGLLEDATQALSGLSRCASLVLAPKAKSPLRHIEFVNLSPGRTLVVLVSENGIVENRVIQTPRALPASALVEATNFLSARLVGRTLGEAYDEIMAELDAHQAELDELTTRVVESGLATWAGDSQEGSLIVRGQAHLLEDVTAASDLEQIRTLFNALETKGEMLKLLSLTDTAEGVQIFIGADNSLFNLAGCSMIVKPASATPFTALALGVLAEEAGIPAGVFNVVTGKASMISDVLTSSETVRKLSFTGSTPVGAHLMAACAPTVKKVSLELGGNAPFIVFDDADIEDAVTGALDSKFRNAGQTCVCANRIYVQSGVYDAFVERLAQRTSELSVGKGSAEGVEVGPLISEKAVEKVEAHLQDALDKGGRLITGGKRHALGGTWFEPTVVADVTADMACAREETFGPLAPVFRFETEAEVIRQANDTEYGLAAYFYAESVSRIWRVSEALEYGMVSVNSVKMTGPPVPFGGVKQSGLGREGGATGIDEYLETKYYCLGALGSVSGS